MIQQGLGLASVVVALPQGVLDLQLGRVAHLVRARQQVRHILLIHLG